MRIQDQFSLAAQGVTASTFSLLSNTVSILVGLLFFGLLVSLSLGVAQFLEAYYTRTMSLTTLIVYNDPETSTGKAFTKEYRESLGAVAQVERIFYHDINFADLAISQGRTTTAALRSAVAEDPEIDRLELIAGSNLQPFRSPDRFGVLLPLNRAQSLSDLPPQELIGLELAISFLRTMNTDSDDQEHTVYGTVTGIVNETPDSCVYVPYELLAATALWQREVRRGPVGEAVLSVAEPVKAEITAAASPERVEIAAPESLSPTSESVAPELVPKVAEESAERGITGDGAVALEHETRGAAELDFKYAKLKDAWDAVSTDVTTDALIYPHMRIHVDTVESLVALRKYFREQGNPTESVLDDVNTVRELRQYALFIGTCIGGITLIAALCSIFNTLLASVERRTREIGILRALGASRFNVLTIFLAEGVINTVVGGILAAVIMYFTTVFANQWLFARLKDNADFSKLVELQPNLFLYPAWLPVLVVGVGMAAALLASFFPAVRACSVSPTAALRHD